MNSQEYSSVSQVENIEENQDNPPEYQVFLVKILGEVRCTVIYLRARLEDSRVQKKRNPQPRQPGQDRDVQASLGSANLG